MKKLLWISIVVSGFAFAQQSGDIQEMPETAEALLAACKEQESAVPAEAVEMFNETCSCLAESIDFDKVKEFKANNDQAGMVSHVQEVTISCAPEMPAQ